MITPFGLHHIPLIRSLSGASSVLDFRSALLEPETPLRAALRGYFLRSRSGVFTFVLRAPDLGKNLHGFAQARALRPEAAWSILRMAPALDSSKDAATIWYRLLLHLCIAAGERRVQRLLARVSEGGVAEEVFRQAGFSVYCRERVYRCDSAVGAGRLSSHICPLCADDLASLQRLCQETTPRPVLLSEGVRSIGDQSRPPQMLDSDTEWYEGFYRLDHPGSMSAAVRILAGANASWLRLLIPPDPDAFVAEMLDHALARLSACPPRPVYCTVRDYQGGVQAPLEERDFTLTETHSLLVKHTTVRVREAPRKALPSFEKRVEVAPTVSQSEANAKVR